MAVGFSQTNYIQKVLNHMHRATASTPPAGQFVALHTADPGAAGATAPASVTTRSAATFAAPSGTSVALTGTKPSWATWAGTNGQVITHISVWDAATAGTFQYSAALTASKTMATGDTLTLDTLSVSLTPAAT